MTTRQIQRETEQTKGTKNILVGCLAPFQMLTTNTSQIQVKCVTVHVRRGKLQCKVLRSFLSKCGPSTKFEQNPEKAPHFMVQTRKVVLRHL